MIFLPRMFLLALLVSLGLATLASPPPVRAQSAETLLENPVCRENPHSEDCICAEVRRFGMFPKDWDTTGAYPVPKDVDGDGFSPQPGEDGTWVDDPKEKDNASDKDDPEWSDLVFAVDDRYGQRCSMSYFRENNRRLWFFAVALGSSFTVLSLIWIGVTYMQYSASGVDLSRARMHLTRVLIGLFILAMAFIVWEGVRDVLFSGEGVQSWTQERGIYYDLR